MASVLAEMPDLFGSKFDRLNQLNPIAAGDTNVLFDASYGLTQTPDLAADATGSAIDLFDQITDLGLPLSPDDNLKFDRPANTPNRYLHLSSERRTYRDGFCRGRCCCWARAIAIPNFCAITFRKMGFQFQRLYHRPPRFKHPQHQNWLRLKTRNYQKRISRFCPNLQKY